MTWGPEDPMRPSGPLADDADVYTVFDAETGRILAVDKTLTQAMGVRDALVTLGDPRITRGMMWDREGDQLRAEWIADRRPR